jgi:hypothetical protein
MVLSIGFHNIPFGVGYAATIIIEGDHVNVIVGPLLPITTCPPDLCIADPFLFGGAQDFVFQQFWVFKNRRPTLGCFANGLVALDRMVFPKGGDGGACAVFCSQGYLCINVSFKESLFCGFTPGFVAFF